MRRAFRFPAPRERLVALFSVRHSLILRFVRRAAYPNPSDTLPSVGISSPGSSTGTLM
jgi:hypothetical protein